MLLSRLKRDGNAVGLEVDGVALGELLAGEVRWEDIEGDAYLRVTGLAASSDVGTAGLLDGDGNYNGG